MFQSVSLTVTELLVVCVIILAVVWLITTFWERHSSPPGPFPLPLLGNIFNIIRSDPAKLVADLAQQYGPVVKVKLARLNMIYLCDPASIQV